MTDPQSWNKYAYARNNPLKFTDPTGLAIEYRVFRQEGYFERDSDFYRWVWDNGWYTLGGDIYDYNSDLGYIGSYWSCFIACGSESELPPGGPNLPEPTDLGGGGVPAPIDPCLVPTAGTTCKPPDDQDPVCLCKPPNDEDDDQIQAIDTILRRITIPVVTFLLSPCKPSEPESYALTVTGIFPAPVGVAVAFAYVPSTGQRIYGLGLGVTEGRSFSVGTLKGDGGSKVEDVVSGPGLATGVQLHPAVGIQWAFSSGGRAGGASAGTPGLSIALTYGVCRQ